MREWRVNTPELFFDNNDCIIITLNETQLFELTQEEGELEDFIIDYIKDGQYIIERPTLPQIITEAVNHFGGEQ